MSKKQRGKQKAKCEPNTHTSSKTKVRQVLGQTSLRRDLLELLGSHDRQHALDLEDIDEALKRETHYGHWIVRVEVQDDML